MILYLNNDSKRFSYIKIQSYFTNNNALTWPNRYDMDKDLCGCSLQEINEYKIYTEYNTEYTMYPAYNVDT